MTKRERERKIKMFGMIGMSILVISSLATATYAWFTKINVSASTGTLTVIAPDDYSYYSYKGNNDPSHTPTGTFGDDFLKVTNENKEAETNFTGMYPGQSKIYCIEIASKTAGNDVSLVINSLISNNALKQGDTYKRTVSGTTTEINVGWAIDITSMASTDGSGYYEGNDSDWLVVKNASGPLSGDIFNETNFPTSTLNSGSHANQIISLGTPVSMFTANATQKAWTSIYIFYRVYFSDATTTLYGEINASGGYNVPVTDGNRVFQADAEGGTSNCYAGLTFQLKTLTLSF